MPGLVPQDQGVLRAIGDTPLVRLDRLLPDGPTLWAKLEMLNPGGSAKDRPAHRMVCEALADGRVAPGGLVVESSSGNMAIGLAQACAVHGLRFHAVVDRLIQRQNLALVRAYGGTVEFIEPRMRPGESRLEARLRRVREIVRDETGAWWPNQYANPANPAAHATGTMREIDEALGGRVDLVLAATSTTGTIGGCRAWVAEQGRDTRVVGVDAVGSVLFGGRPGERLISGLGAGIEPDLARTADPDAVVRVTALDCVLGCRRLAAREGILAGGSSGGVITALTRMTRSLPRDSICAVILADRGSRYLDTIYDDGWVRETLGVSADELAAHAEGAGDDDGGTPRWAVA